MLRKGQHAGQTLQQVSQAQGLAASTHLSPSHGFIRSRLASRCPESSDQSEGFRDEGRLNHVQIPADQKNGLVNHQSSVEAKITLFRSLFRGREDVYLGPMPQHYDPRPGFAAFPQPEYELYESEMQQHPIPQARAPMPELPNVERLPSYNDCLMINELFEQTMKECIAYPDIRETIPDDHDVRDQGIMNSQDTLEDLVADHSLQDPMQEIEAAFD